MGSAPLHAARIYDDHSKENAMEFAVSSYIHTVKALKFARETLQKQRGETQEALLVTATDDLDFENEIQEIRRVIKKQYKTVSLKDESRENVLRQLERSS